MIGTRLAHYEIASHLGTGGMGEVYQATDSKLGRSVAIKLLPAVFTHDVERVARFEREARVLASLNQPNIAAIYGVEESAGRKFLVMELVSGETLADQIQRGPIAVAESLRIAAQIAEALEAAHDKGVVHRDLKPANIKITADGKVKVLDFGLAKAFEGETANASVSNSPTISRMATQQGIILGTAAYMSPEQARGRTVDRRTDIFAFGAVLYEMLTADPAFGGEDVTEILGRVVAVEPDWNRLPTATPLPIRRLLRRALKKDPRQRLADIHDARLEIEEASNASAQEEAASVLQKRGMGQRTMGALAAVLALVALALGIALWAPWRTEPLKPLVRLEVDLGAEVALPIDAGQASVVLSPDGTRLAYVASVAGAPSRLYTRRLDQLKATELPGTQGAQGTLFSPDSQWIGFQVAGKLSKISVEGGAVVPLADLGIPAGGAWAEDDRILMGAAVSNGLRVVPPSGGQTVKLTDLGSGEIAHAVPQFLPGSKFALIAVYQQVGIVDTVTIEAINLADGKRKAIRRGGTFPRYLPSGHLLYVNKSTLFAIPFDPDKLETSGNAVPILDDVKFHPNTSIPDLSFSRNGTLVYRRSGVSLAGQIVQWINLTGKRSPLMAKAGVYNNPRLSPDAKRMAVQLTEGGSADVWVYDLQRDTTTKLTFGGGSNNPVWTPDGRFIIFQKPGAGLFWTPANGSGQPQPLIESPGIRVPWSMSPDGKRLAFFEVGNVNGWIHTVEVTEQGGTLKAGKPELFFESTFQASSPEFSPDGHWIAYQTNESGRTEVVVRAFRAPLSGQGGKWLISTNGGTLPRWSRTSRDELLYMEGDRIMAVSYTVNGNSFVADKPRVHIEKLGGTIWDVAPDGRIAVLTPVASPQAPAAEHTVVFLENFFDELRRRVPVGK